MRGIGQYVFSVTAAAVVVALIRPMLEGKGTITTVGKILGGVFLLFTVLQPLNTISISNLDALTDPIQVDAQAAVSSGQDAAKKELTEIISTQLETYILDKAAQYDSSLSVEVALSDDDIPVPVGVTIRGSISPYGKRQLQAFMEKDLGIAKEDQIWI